MSKKSEVMKVDADFYAYLKRKKEETGVDMIDFTRVLGNNLNKNEDIFVLGKKGKKHILRTKKTQEHVGFFQ